MSGISYNIIDSVKGGSGKTSLTLMLALAAQAEAVTQQLSAMSLVRQETEQYGAEEKVYLEQPRRQVPLITATRPPIHSLVLDMDMQGSSLSSLLFGGEEAGKNGKAIQYLDDRILNYYRNKMERFISYPKFHFKSEGAEGRTKTHRIGVALANPEMERREAFRANSRTNYSTHITYTTFMAGLRDVLKGIKWSCPDLPDYIFFDMPPNSNGYSDAVLELLLRKAKKGPADFPGVRNYFALTTLDRGHIDTTLRWFQEFVNNTPYEFPDHFFFTFNNIPIGEMELPEGARQTLAGDGMDIISNRLDDILRGVPYVYRSRIFFLGCSFQPEYLKICSSRDAIGASKNIELPDDLLYPIAFLRPLGSTNKEDSDQATSKLLKLLRNKE